MGCVAAGALSVDHLEFFLEPVPPFRLDLTAWAIRRRPENAMDTWDGETYGRVLALGRTAALLAVRQAGVKSAPRLLVSVRGARLPPATQARATAALERLLGFRISLTSFYRLAAQDRRLHELAARFRGLKPPRFATVFEALLNGIACQQLSLAVGIILLNRLSAAHGLRFEESGESRHAVPRPEDLMRARDRSLRALGFSRNKIRALREAAAAAAGGGLDLESFSGLDDETATGRLLELRGIGRWTAEYVLLRGLGRLAFFPGDDIGARNNLARWLHLRAPLDYDRVARVLGKWRRYAGLVYFHLLLDRLQAAGHVR